MTVVLMTAVFRDCLIGASDVTFYMDMTVSSCSQVQKNLWGAQDSSSKLEFSAFEAPRSPAAEREGNNLNDFQEFT